MRAYRLRNLERVREHGRRSYVRNKETHSKCSKRWKDANPDKVKLSNRLSDIRCRVKRREYKRRWQKDNPDKVIAYTQKRRALAKEALTSVVKKLYLKHFCHWCWSLLTEANRTIDHIVPLCRGGSHSEENLVACCGKCNYSKARKLYWEWDGDLAC